MREASASKPPMKPLSAIFPSHLAPVVRQSADLEIVTMSWSFVLLQKERAPGQAWSGPGQPDQCQASGHQHARSTKLNDLMG